MIEIYIDGGLVDLNDGDGVQFAIKTNFMDALDDIEASRTYSITLPATKNNIVIVGLVNDSAANALFRRKKYDAVIYIDGFQITTNAKAYLVGAKKDSIDIVIAWNTTSAFTRFGEDNLTDMVVNDPTLYDYLPYTSAQTFEKPTSEISDKKGYFWYNNKLPASDNTTVHYHHPCVSAQYILEKIEQAYKVNFSNIDLSDYNDILFPLVTNFTSEQGLEWQGLTSTDVHFQGGSELAYYRIMPAHALSQVQILPIFKDMLWTVVINTSYYTNEYADSFRIKCHFECDAANTLQVLAYDTDAKEITQVIAQFPTDENNQINLDETIEYQGDFLLTFSLDNAINPELAWFKIIPDYNKSLFFDPAYSRSGRFDIMANLPDMKVSEFIADFCALIGAFPAGRGDNISDGTFQDLDLIKYNDFFDYTATEHPGVLDWSEKFVEIKQTEYLYDASAKRIKFGLAMDEYSFDGSETIEVDDDNAEEESDYFDAVLTSMNGYYLPLYAKSVDSNDEATFELNDMSPKVGVKTVIDETYLGCTGIDEKTIFKPYFGLFGLLATKYALVSAILSNFQKITADFYLKAYDLAQFSSGKPIYVSELGGYFAVLSIDFDSKSALSEVVMIKIP